MLEFPACVELYLADLFDLAASLPYERATLAGRHHDAQGDRGLAGGRAVGHGATDVLRGEQKRSQKVSNGKYKTTIIYIYTQPWFQFRYMSVTFFLSVNEFKEL